jgi:hypothetical protein
MSHSEEAVPYFFQVARYLMPDVLRILGFTGEITFDTELNVSRESCPDNTISYNGKNMLALDYKGPNCINLAEIRSSTALSVNDAHKRFQDISSIRANKQEMTLLSSRSVTQDTIRLIKQRCEVL